MIRSLRPFLLSFVALTVFAAASLAQAAPPSGMLLGVYAFENFRGLRIVDTIPGYSAEGRLFPGDVLMQATTDGSQLFCIRTLAEFEEAKDAIGPNTPAAIEVFRPNVGKTYFWVEFAPAGGGAGVHAYSTDGTAAAMQPRMKAQFRTEAERPGARALFNGGNQGNQGNNGGFRNVPTSVQGSLLPNLGRNNPGSLFRN